MTITRDAGSEKGVSWVASSESSIYNVLNTSSCLLHAPLQASLLLSRGTGSPTFTRATKAWALNELGLLEEISSGCAFFQGARLVRNLCPTPSNTLAVSGTKTVTLTASATLQFSMGAGTGTATFSGTGGATGTLSANASARVSVNKIVGVGTFIVTASVADLVDLSITDVTGYDASYVPEYVSVGVVSAPFFGAGIDGAKYYETDWKGAPIPATNLLGFRRESAATNNVLYSRDLVRTQWDCPSGSGAGSEILTNGTFGDANGWSLNGAEFTISSGTLNMSSTTGGSFADNTQTYATMVTGKQYLIEFDVNYTSGSMPLLVVRGNTSKAISASTGRKTMRVTCGSSVAGYGIRFATPGTAGVCSIDNISIKECAIQATLTATGLDGVANTATTLTAAAEDAIILQPITLASAARCASAYVKRRTGTGTVSFTQDGGSTWTDITSQINSSTWSRVQITSTLANPSVGFKISTSGDAIDVDCVQNEAGSVATSPIVTTTATVTRNADSLTYQTASNWSDTAGTAFVEVAPLAYSGGAIGSATNGLLLSTSNSGATAYDGTNSANGPSGTPGSSEKLAFRWGSGAMTVSSGGVIGTPGTYDGGMELSVIGVGSSAAGCFRNVAIYNYAMTDAELRAVTA